MFQSRTISVAIERPYADAYAYMVEPRNIPSWSSIPADTFRHISDMDFGADLPTGPATIRFSPPNPYGVLDYLVTPASGPQRQVLVRLIPNASGCELLYTLFQREGVSDGHFGSEVEWITTELLVLKTLLASSGSTMPSRTVSLGIERPYEQVYPFLQDGRNFPRWASNIGPNFDPLGGGKWMTDREDGRFILQFPALNPYGVLDHSVTRPGDPVVIVPMRAVRNGGGTELLYTLFMGAGTSDAAFASEAEWVLSDFVALKSLLEAI